MTGYICKRCGSPAPTGIGYAVSGRNAAKQSANLNQCRCGYSSKESAK